MLVSNSQRRFIINFVAVDFMLSSSLSMRCHILRHAVINGKSKLIKTIFGIDVSRRRSVPCAGAFAGPCRLKSLVARQSGSIKFHSGTVRKQREIHQCDLGEAIMCRH